MSMLTYITKILSDRQEDLSDLRKLLEYERDVFNLASIEQYPEKNRSIVVLHNKVYAKVRKERPEIPSQVVIRGEQACLSAYSTIKSNKHRISKPVEKKRLSIRLDKRLYAPVEKGFIRITTAHGRKRFGMALYPKLEDLLDQYQYKDPLVFERNGDLYLAMTFDVAVELVKQKMALGVDLGCRVNAATSDGRLIIDKKFAKEKRRLRFLKRQLQSCGTKSARRHLKKISHKEANKNKNQTHLIANAILQTNADTIVLENLKSIKVKKHKGQNKNRISQVPLYELRRIITYKAGHMGKHVMLVCPSYTSQIDCLTGKLEGERRGRRFYAKSGLIYDADINASINIAKLSKLPHSQSNLLAGQAVVTRPNVCKSSAMGLEYYRPATLVVGR